MRWTCVVTMAVQQEMQKIGRENEGCKSNT